MKALTDVERRMLELLDFETPQRPGFLGACLWKGSASFRMPQHFARPAGRVLKGLEKRGLIEWVSRANNIFGWIKLKQQRRVKARE